MTNEKEKAFKNAYFNTLVRINEYQCHPNKETCKAAGDALIVLHDLAKELNPVDTLCDDIANAEMLQEVYSKILLDKSILTGRVDWM